MSDAMDAGAPPDLTVIIVSYNTRALTLKCLETLYANTHETRFRAVVFDNASSDGSADAVAAAFPQAELIASPENLGFARANNVVAAQVTTDWLLLLNPDTEVHAGAVDRLMAFARAHPQAGITGGRTVFPDGSLNIASCWNRLTPWSAFCMATGLTAAFRGSEFFNPEGMGRWARDSVREVDIVVGCFLMIRRDLWNRLGGFDLKYYMYGEEADMCLRARAMGYRPMITPDAQIMHLVGASSGKLAHKLVMVAQARATLIRDHWPGWQVPFGLAMMWLWAALRVLAARGLVLTGRPGARDAAEKWTAVWAKRRIWLAGYRNDDMAATATATATGAARVQPVAKKRLSRSQRLMRLVGGALDPRAWFHLVRMVNYWNYSHVTPRRKLTLGPGAQISPDAVFANPERIAAGRGLRLGSRCHLWAGPGHGRIAIGDDALFGPDVLVTAAGYRFNDGHPVTDQAMDEADVVLGNDVWIGAKCVILPGARIGDGAIVGAGSVVRGEIPAMSVAVGVPARVVATRRIDPAQTG